MLLRLGRVLFLIQVLLLLAACRSLPHVSPGETVEHSPTPGPTPSVTVPLPVRPYPPVVVAFSPGMGMLVGTDAALTWEFSEAMDRQRLMDGFRTEPVTTGAWVWSDDRTVSFQPTDLAPGLRYQVHFGEDVQSAAGLSLSGRRTFSFSTLPPLRVVRVSPAEGEGGLRTDVPIRITFNRPVVGPECVGALAMDDRDCPEPLPVISPGAAGRGFWLHPTVYQYELRDGLSAGVTYQVTLRSGFVGFDGGGLAESVTWSFATAPPRIVALWPAADQPAVPLSAAIYITFSTPMDQVFTGGAFSLLSEDGTAVAGTLTWEDGGGVLVFTPAAPLTLGTTYQVRVGERARAVRSAPLENPQRSAFRTVPYPKLVAQAPERGERGVDVDAPVQLTLEGAIDVQSLGAGVEISPAVTGGQSYAVFDSASGAYSLMWPREPRTEYCVTLRGVAEAGLDAGAPSGAGIVDIYGHPLVAPEPICFTTGDLPPRFDRVGQGVGVTLDAGRPAVFQFLARNVGPVDFVLARVSATSLMQRRYEGSELLREWRETFDTGLNAPALLEVPLLRAGGSLPTGLYRLSWQAPGSGLEEQTAVFAVVDQHITVKLSMQEGLVWLTSLTTGLPVNRTAVRLVDEEGLLIAGGTTDEDGLAYVSTTNLQGLSRPLAVIVGEPGEPGFGFVLVSWQGAASPDSFGLERESGPRLPYRTFVETDAAVYRPGDRIAVAGWLRKELGARYPLPAPGEALTVQLRNPDWQVIYSSTLRTADTGSFVASLILPEDAAPGSYRLEVLSRMPLPGYGAAPLLASLDLEVLGDEAPALAITVEAEERDVVAGEVVRYAIEVYALQGEAVPGTEVTWRVFAESYAIAARYRKAGLEGWLWSGAPGSGRVLVGEGAAAPAPGADGRFRVELPASPVMLGDGTGAGPQRWILEATVRDESGVAVTASDETIVHGSALYVGVRPKARVVQARERVTVDLLTVGLDGAPVSATELSVRLFRRLWEQDAAMPGEWRYTDVAVTEQSLTTSADGSASAGFTIVQTGAYMVVAEAVDASGRRVRSEAELWVSGSEAAAWRTDRVRLALVADGASGGECAGAGYRVGDVARVLVPTTFEGAYQLLLTVERDGILQVERYSMERPNPILTLPIQESYAPNVYLSVVLMQPRTETQPAQVQVGYLNLCVDPETQRLSVAITADKAVYGPGESAHLTIETLDSAGRPVDAEVIVSLVKAGSHQPVWQTFYGVHPLGVRMGDTLLVSMDRGAEALPDDVRPLRVREPGSTGSAYPETPAPPRAASGQGTPATAFWSGPLRTGTKGRIEARVVLPDALASWDVVVRAMTEVTQVGEAQLTLDVHQALYVQASTPRFVVLGDRTQFTAMVRNTTAEDLLTEVWLETGEGLALVSAESRQQIMIPSGSRRYVSWTVDVVEDGGKVARAVFGARAGGDATVVVAAGAGAAGIPIHRLTTRDGPRATGVLSGAGTRVEPLMVPPWAAAGTRLTVRIEPSPLAPLYEMLQEPAKLPIDIPDVWASRLLPVVASYAALERAAGLQSEELDALQASAAPLVAEALEHIYVRQNADGGWGWGRTSSDVHKTSYVLYALLRAEDAGFPVNPDVTAAGLRYLFGALESGLTAEPGPPHLAFALYVLSEARTPWPQGAGARLYGERALLGTEDLQFLALALGAVDASDPRVKTLLSEVTGTVVTGGAGAYWARPNRGAWSTQRQVTAVGMMTLLRLAPHDPLLPEVVRWLMLNRPLAPTGGGYESAWISTVLADYLGRAAGHAASVADWRLALNGVVWGEAASETQVHGAGWSSVVSLFGDAGPLRQGLNIVELTRGAGEPPLTYSLRLDPVLPLDLASERAAGEARGVVLDRRYCSVEPAADPSDVEELASCWRVAAVRVGDVIEVRVTVSVPDTRDFLVLEVPYPAGFDPAGIVDLQPGAAHLPGFERQELHAIHARFHARELKAGTYEVAFRLRATRPGVYWSLPAVAEQLYLPEVWGSTAIDSLTVHPAFEGR